MNDMIQSPTRKMSWAGTMKVPLQKRLSRRQTRREREKIKPEAGVR